jgi:hypothetical protein
MRGRKWEHHSTYQGYDIYYNSTLKRRPWSAHIFPDREESAFADKPTLAACKKMIDRVARRDRHRALRGTLIDYGVDPDGSTLLGAGDDAA